ncbi:MAG: hypothetical protein D6714_18990, partial [Bacteroidetes bacterium]
MATATQIVSISDATPPVILDIPEDISVACDAIPAAPDLTASDNCDSDVELILTETITPGVCLESYKIIRTWTATDDCGNTAVAIQEVAVSDNTPPQLINIPADLTVECVGDVPAPPVDGIVTASDNCAMDVTIDFLETSVPTACGETITRKWMATDGCGNTSEAVQTIAVVDTEAPELTNIPADVTVECDAVPTAANPVATDNCDDDVSVNFSDIIEPGACDNAYRINRTWTATDNCGNETSATQIITVEDHTAPVLSGVPSDYTGSCKDDPGVPTVTATDNCDADVSVVMEETTELTDCGAIITRTWTATDACGNASSESQVVELTDTQAPVWLSLPDDLTVDCDNIPTAESLEVEDDCSDNIEVVFSDVITPGACAYDYVITRTWTATDLCGNAVETTQQIVVLDVKAPVFDQIPQNLTAECGDLPPVPNVTATDNCDGDVEIIYEESSVPAACGEIITRKWTAVDDCGNPQEVEQIITVQDTEPPHIPNVPADITIACDQVPAAPPIMTATDNCDADVQVTYEEEMDPEMCEESYIITRKWTATDACGNTSTEIQTITATDDEAPELIGVPADVTVNLGNGDQMPTMPNVMATDNCDANVEIEFTETNTPNADGYILEWNWLATDNCGNFAEETMTITVIETIMNAAIMPENPVMCGGGTITLMALPDDPDFTYEWSSTAGSFDDPNAQTVEFTINQPGDFIVTVNILNANGASASAATTVTVNQLPDMTLSASTPICAGETLQLSATPGADTYVWSGPAGFTSSETNPVLPDMTSNGTGWYVLTAIFGNCEVTDSVEVEVFDYPNFEAVTTGADCMTPGAIELVNTGAPGNYVFNWADLPGNDNPANRTGLAAGNYSVTISEGNNCELILNDLEITFENNLSANSTILQPSNCGQADGAAAVEVVSGGSGNYSFVWSDGGTGAMRDDLAAGTYEVTVTDLTTTCETTVAVNMEDANMAPAFLAVEGASTSCPGAADGTAQFTVSYDPAFAHPADTVFVDASGMEVKNGELPKGNYCVQIYNAYGCLVIQRCFEIVDPQPLDAEVTVTHVDCVNLGAITITSSGGSGAQKYDWADVPGNDNFKDRFDLSPGFYSVTVYDGNGCDFVLNDIEVKDNCAACVEPVITNITTTDADCLTANGSAVIELDGDVSEFNFYWNPPVSTSNMSSTLSAAFYHVTIARKTDPNCYTETTIVINNKTGPQPTDIKTTPDYCGAGNGQVEFLPSDYLYLWNMDNQVMATRSDLSAGTYYVAVIDPQNAACPTQLVLTIDSTATLGVSENIIAQPTCDNANGSVEIEAVGGSGNFEYLWNDGATSATRNDLAAGTWSVTVNDPQTGCSGEVTFDLPAQISIAHLTTADTTVSCFGENDGFVTITLDKEPGFVEPASMFILDANQNEHVNGGLAPGNYCVRLFDGNDCFVTESCFEITAPQALTLDTAVSHATCDTLGTISITVNGGTPPYQFDWADLAGNDNQAQRSGLAAGTYEVTVTDAHQCLTSISVAVEDQCVPIPCDAPEVISADITAANCDSNDGSAILTLTKDPTNYVFVWSGNVSSTNEASGLAAGAYVVTITNATDTCSTEWTVLVGTVDGPAVQLLGKTPATCLAANGTAQFAPDTYLFEWSDGGTGASRDDLAAGVYQITITDPATGCQDFEEFEIEQTNPLTAQAAILAEPACGNANGSAEIQTNQSGSLEFAWSDGTTEVHNGQHTRNDLAAGAYTVTITDLTSNCTATASLTLTDQISTAQVTAQDVQTSCFGAHDATAVYDYTPEPGFAMPASVEIKDQNGELVQNGTLGAGTYCVTVWDANGCEAGTACFEVTQPTELTAQVTIQPAGCDENGSIELAPTGGTPAYTFLWNDGETTQNRTGLPPGTWSVTVTDQQGCTLELVDLVVENDCTVGCIEPVVLQTSVMDATCGNADGSATIEVDGNPSDFIWTWSGGVSTTASAQGLAPGAYAVTIARLADPTCQTVISLQVGEDCTTVCDEPVITNTIIVDAKCGEANGAATIELSENPNNFNFIWSNNASSTNYATDLLSGTYAVTIVRQSDPNCFLETTIVIGNIDGPQVTVGPATPANCNAADGQVSLTPAGINYQWSDGLSGASRNDLAAGTYFVTATDPATGCDAVVEVVIEQMNNLGAEATILAQPTCGHADGSVQILVENGSGNYLFEWSNGATGNPQNNLPAGAFTVTITDQISGCETTTAFVLSDEVIGATVLVDDFELPCAGDENGTVVYDIQYEPGFVQPADIEIINDQNQVVSNGNLAAGSYCINVTDGNGCLAESACFEVTQPTELQVVVTKEPATCNEGGKIDLAVTGGAGSYTFEWNDGATTAKRNDLQPGIYAATITDQNGCSVQVSDIEIGDDCGTDCTPPLVTNIETTDTDCGQANGAATLTLSGNISDYAFAWTNNV